MFVSDRGSLSVRLLPRMETQIRPKNAGNGLSLFGGLAEKQLQGGYAFYAPQQYLLHGRLYTRSSIFRSHHQLRRTGELPVQLVFGGLRRGSFSRDVDGLQFCSANRIRRVRTRCWYTRFGSECAIVFVDGAILVSRCSVGCSLRLAAPLETPSSNQA